MIFQAGNITSGKKIKIVKFRSEPSVFKIERSGFLSVPVSVGQIVKIVNACQPGNRVYCNGIKPGQTIPVVIPDAELIIAVIVQLSGNRKFCPGHQQCGPAVTVDFNRKRRFLPQFFDGYFFQFGMCHYPGRAETAQFHGCHGVADGQRERDEQLVKRNIFQ